MIRNNLKVALRSIRKKPLYSLINIFGLALGLTGAMLIWQYVSFEKSYDDFHGDRDRIFRLPLYFDTGGRQDGADAMNSAPAGPALKEELPEVEAFVRMTPEYGRTVFQFGDKQFEEQKVFYADSNFFDFFGYELMYGDPQTLLTNPGSIVLTKQLAEKYFGPASSWGESPVGKTLHVNGAHDFEVTGVAEDPPENTHFKFNALTSFSTFLMFSDPSGQWEWNDFYTYVRLRDPVNIPVFSEKLQAFADRHINTSDKRTEYKVHYGIQPIQEIHLHSNLGYEAEPNGNARTVNFLMIVALAILSIAWANYINLATARAEERAEEVGVRKVIGANKKSLITQFLSEAFMVNALAVLLSLILISLCQPLMNSLTGKSLISIFADPISLTTASIIVLVLGTLFSGLYPAFVLSSFKPIRTLQSGSRGKRNWFRMGLVTFQYTCSIILIICTLIIFRQLDYMENTDLGFSMEQKIVVNTPSVYVDSIERNLYPAFRNSLMQNPSIQNVTASSAIPGKFYYDLDSWGGIRMQGAAESMGASFTCFRIDDDFFSTYELEIITGNDFSRETSTDDISAAVSEAALPLLGIASPEEAIGKKVRLQGNRIVPIINVFKNYHHKSLRHQYEPMILWTFPPDPDPLYYTVKFQGSQPGEVKRAVEHIGAVWQEVFPENPFTYFFFDDQYNEQYRADARLGKITGIFSLFAVFIACLGLFGLTSYMIMIRTKEIGIRKVLGASVRQIILLLTRDFLQLVFLAMIIAIPLAWYFGSSWLDGFPFRISMRWSIFLVSGAIVIFIAALTVSMQSVKAALASPINALRDD